jgi:hypothetical protein
MIQALWITFFSVCFFGIGWFHRGITLLKRVGRLIDGLAFDDPDFHAKCSMLRMILEEFKIRGTGK